MKNVIEYFYKMEIGKIVYTNNKYYFQLGVDEYIFEECPESLNMELIIETQKFPVFHTIITNSLGNIFTSYENKKYILLKVNVLQNRKISLSDIWNVANLKLVHNTFQQDWATLWEKKIDYFEMYILSKEKDFYFREYYDYYIGMGENAITYYHYGKQEDIRYGFSYKRVNPDSTLFDLYDPTNVIIAPVVRGVSEYIKFSFFFGHPVSIEEIEQVNFGDYEAIMLVSRLLFPTYFFDMCKGGDNCQLANIKKMMDLSTSYEVYLCDMIRIIKKRHKQMPIIKWLQVSQL